MIGKNKEMGLPFGTMQKVRIAVDIDGTLRCNCTPACEDPNQRIVDWFNITATFKNTDMYVWSGSGKEYAARFARKFGLNVKYSHIVGKIGAPPMDVAVDDIQDTAIGRKINLIVREK